jgi:orotate phosphoribosyltransferase-like protein
MVSAKKKKGGRVTESPKKKLRSIADGLADEFVAAGWEEADEDDVAGINAHTIPLSTVCTCTLEETAELITTVANTPDALRQAVVIMLHDGPAYTALIWPGAA